MGIINDMKKLLFGAKAVGKSAANKAVDAGKEAGEELMERSGEMFEKAKDKAGDVLEKARDIAEDVGGKILTAGEKAYDSAKSFAEDVTNDIFDEKEPEPKPTETKPADTTASHPPITDPDLLLEAPDEPQEPEINPLLKKAASTAEKVGEKVLDAGDKAMEKASELAEKVGEQLKTKGEDMLHTFKGAAEKASDKFEALFDKAQEEAAKEEAESSIVKDAKKTIDETTSQMEDFMSKAKEFTDEPPKTSPNLGKSELAGKDDFFEKAKRFAEGDYHGTGKKTEEGKITLSEDPTHEPKKKDNGGAIKGFDDLDGDGDHLIDDAIIDDGDDDDKK
ncbi:MAG: hypothetical protein IPL49_13250 [Saprospirales bacterium]|nr:hypothetical protein [Saprospirales bacterium]